LAPLVRVLSHGMPNEESDSRERFVAMIVLLFILSAALIAVLMLFSISIDRKRCDLGRGKGTAVSDGRDPAYAQTRWCVKVNSVVNCAASP
jgi:hypothetical protein